MQRYTFFQKRKDCGEKSVYETDNTCLDAKRRMYRRTAKYGKTEKTKRYQKKIEI